MIALSKKYYYFLDQWDNAYFAQILWDILHGSLSPSILNANFLTDHCFFLTFLLVPVYWIWPDPLLLEYVKIGVFFTGAYVFFLILKKYLHPWIALGAMIAFILAPANITLLCSRFNYEPFAIPLFFFIFKALDDNNFKFYIISCFLLAMVKEQMPLAVMMFGVLALLLKKEEKAKWALVPILMGMAVFIFEVFILIPYLRKDLPMSAGFHWNNYTQFGKTPQEILLYLFTHPLSILEKFVSRDNINWYNGLFSVWGSLAFLSPHILLPAALLFLKTILSANKQEHLISQFYYASTYTPFIYLAAWNTLNYIQNKWRFPIHVLVLGIMFIHDLMYIPPKIGLLNPRVTNNTLIMQRYIDRIPSNASVLSAWTTLTPLANRKDLNLVRNYLLGYYYISQNKFNLSQNTDYLLLDFEGEELLKESPKKYIPKMIALNFDDRWRLQESIEDIALYVKNPSKQSTDRLIDRSMMPFPVKDINPKTIDDTIRFESIKFPRVFPQKYRIFPIAMYWKCLSRTRNPYKIQINIKSSKGKTIYVKRRDIGSAIYPTCFWKKEEYVKEAYFCLFPHLSQGEYAIHLYIYSYMRKEWCGLGEYHFTVSGQKNHQEIP